MKPEDLFKKLRPVFGQTLDQLWQEYLLSDAKTQKLIEANLQIALVKAFDETFQEREILLEPPPEELSKGEYALGEIYYGKESFHAFGLREDEWIQHCGIFGRSGSGKTNIAFLIALELLRHEKHILVFDWKRNYRDLVRIAGKEMLIFTVGRDVSPFCFNPLIPPAGTSPFVWLKKLIEIMCHAYFLGEGVSFLLQKSLDAAYRDFGVYDAQSGRYPNLLDVKVWLEGHKAKGREAAWMDSALRALGVLCFGEVGKVLNAPQSYPMEDLLDRNVILELDALTNSDKTFLIETLLLWIHHYRIAQNERELFKHAIIIEEAHHVLLRRKQEIAGEETVTDIILREIRELGESIILIDQHPSLISKPALGNTYFTVAMNLKHRADINMLADSLLLDVRGKKYLGKLDTGWALVKLQGRWHDPFLVRFPLVRVRKGFFTDEEANRSAEPLRSVIRSQSDVSSPSGTHKEVLRRVRGSEKRGTETEKPAGAELKLLLDITQFASSSTTERYQRLGLNAYQGNKAKNTLERNLLIDVKDVPTRSGRIKLLTLTDKSRNLIGTDTHSARRKGGHDHVFWLDRLARHFRARGFSVTLEKPIGQGKTVDMVVSDAVRTIALELETGNSDSVYNIRKCVEAGFERVLSVSLCKSVLDKTEMQLRASGIPRGRVSLLLVSELVDH